MSDAVPQRDEGWHRLHPATPLLRGGVLALAIGGFILIQFRDALIAGFVGQVSGRLLPEDPLLRSATDNAVLVVAIVVGAVLLVVALGWLEWARHEFRVTEEWIEERHGVLWRRHRRGRLDRVQGVDVVRPMIARLFGLATLDVEMAGSDGRIRLAYLRKSHATRLRADILASARLAPRAAPASPDASRPGLGGVVQARLAEFAAPELDERVPLHSVVELHPGRLVGAIALRFAIPMAAVLAAAIVVGLTRPFLLIVIVPVAIGVYGFAGRELLRSLRFTVAATPDGLRIGYGLLSTANETLPPGRVHAIELVQPLFWQPFGWWRVRINRASQAGADGGPGERSHTVLPVGTAAEALRIVGLLLPGWAEPTDFTVSPPRARWLRWFSRRRNGFAFDDRVVVVRRGRLWRTTAIVPLARVQSVAIEDGPLTRAMRLARVDVHTVDGAVRAHVGAIDAADAAAMWRAAEARTLTAMSSEAAA